MNRRNWLLLVFPLFFLTGVRANAGVINFSDLLPDVPGNTCTTVPDPNTPGAEFGSPSGCWTLVNRNSDNTIDGPATGTAFAALSSVTLTGSDANSFDLFGHIFGPMVDAWSGMPIQTLTQFTTVIRDTTPGLTLSPDGVTRSGDLTFTWFFTTLDQGSFYDPAGYILCPATSTGYPSELCGLHQLSKDLDALNAPDPQNPNTPFMEGGTVTVTLAVGDVFGAYALTSDNAGGAGTITFSDSMVISPEPASLLLTGGALLALGWIGRKGRQWQTETAARS
jgi:hypothetical protein